MRNCRGPTLTLVLANAHARRRNSPTDVSMVHGTCDAISDCPGENTLYDIPSIAARFARRLQPARSGRGASQRNLLGSGHIEVNGLIAVTNARAWAISGA